eukprot:TRINITY_DN14286_c0_g1_i1.p2 TRINITY_DN14286_c0_g1~~TRINITY_DN14286_c0_g1_i1.p2  ORF type:complete len:306 (-),score=12.26 TRINITY_DN14286_c0_g1_i1:2097-2969(-)
MDDRRRSDGEISSTKLFITNLTDRTREDTLLEVYEPYGKVVDCKVISDYGSGRSKGFGFVTFADPRDAAKAQAATEGVLELDGKVVVVEFARGKEHPRGSGAAAAAAAREAAAVRDGRPAPLPTKGYDVYDNRGRNHFAERPPRAVPERSYPERPRRDSFDDRGHFERGPVYDDRAPPPRYEDRAPAPRYDDRAREPPRSGGYGPVRSTREYRDPPPRRDERAYAAPAPRYAEPAPYDDYDRRAPRDYPPPARGPRDYPPREPVREYRDAPRGPPQRAPPPYAREDFRRR